MYVITNVSWLFTNFTNSELRYSTHYVSFAITMIILFHVENHYSDVTYISFRLVNPHFILGTLVALFLAKCIS